MDKYVSSSLTKITKNVFDVEKVVVTILGDERTKKKEIIRQKMMQRGKKRRTGEKKVMKESKSFLKTQAQRFLSWIKSRGTLETFLCWWDSRRIVELGQ